MLSFRIGLLLLVHHTVPIFLKGTWNYVVLIIDLVVDFAAMGYNVYVSLRLHDFVDANVKDIFKSNLVAYSENIGHSSIRIYQEL